MAPRGYLIDTNFQAFVGLALADVLLLESASVDVSLLTMGLQLDIAGLDKRR